MLYYVLTIFIIGYLLIALEKTIKINKSAIAILTAALSWVVIALYMPVEHVIGESLLKDIGEISGILFFLIGAMTIVELIDLHDGFDIIVRLIKAKNKVTLLWIISLFTFFLSPLLDNLTTAIVMISILQKILPKDKDRLWFTGMIVIAANAGGVWSPIGDVTTTMLWIGGQLSAGTIVTKLFLPSLVALVIPLLIIGAQLKKEPVTSENSDGLQRTSTFEKKRILFSGIFLLILVPVIKTITHLPPYMCMLISLGILWLISDIFHKKKSEEVRSHLSVSTAMRRIDMPSIIFFLGILLSVSALEETGLLHKIASALTGWEMGHNSIAISLGFLSAIIDNVPLVAAAMGMFPTDFYPTDHNFWSMLAFTSGTGGSMLIIGSAAGIVAMGMEKISFFWYLKNITWIALISFLAGCAVLIFL